MPQIGLHVPDGPEMNLEQAMPHKFQADGPGVIGNDLCQVCGKEQAEHITPPAGETSGSTQDGEMEAAPVTGQSPVGAVSPAPAEEVGALANDDHARGCQGREYTCTCGYDDRVDAALTRLQAENAELEFLLNEGGTWEQQLSKAEAAKDAAERRVADLERITDRLDADLSTSDGHREAAESQLAAAALRERQLREALTEIGWCGFLTSTKARDIARAALQSEPSK